VIRRPGRLLLAAAAAAALVGCGGTGAAEPSSVVRGLCQGRDGGLRQVNAGLTEYEWGGRRAFGISEYLMQVPEAEPAAVRSAGAVRPIYPELVEDCNGVRRL